MRVLVIDNNIDKRSWGASDICRYVVTQSGARAEVRRGPNRDWPSDLSLIDHIVISGSITSILDDAPWISELHDLIRRAVNDGKPLLGICYGHQSIARALGGKPSVRRAVLSEFGWSRIEKIADSKIFNGLPKVFYSFSSHYDEVQELPPGFKRLAKSELCVNQAFEIEDKPVFGVQFHPERNLEEGSKFYQKWVKAGKAKGFLHGKEAEKFFNPHVAEKIFENFLSI